MSNKKGRPKKQEVIKLSARKYLRKMFLNDKKHEIRKAPFLFGFQLSIMGALGFIAWTLAFQIYKGKQININDMISFFSMISVYSINLYSMHKSKTNDIAKRKVDKDFTVAELAINKKIPTAAQIKKDIIEQASGPAVTNPMDTILK